jgi:hypothetical protein
MGYVPPPPPIPPPNVSRVYCIGGPIDGSYYEVPNAANHLWFRGGRVSWKQHPLTVTGKPVHEYTRAQEGFIYMGIVGHRKVTE